MMRHFRLSMDPVILEMAPTFCGLVVYVDGIDNSESDAWSRRLLLDAKSSVGALPGPPALHPHMQAWARVYRGFGARPKLYQNGCLALAQREDVPQINALVDMYNAMAMKHMLPIGGEDWDKLESDLLRTTALGHEVFLGAGVETAPEHPRLGEPIWLDAAGVTTRRFNWRQCGRTRITLATRAAYFVLDAVAPFTFSNLEAAAEELLRRLRERWPEATSEVAPLARAPLDPHHPRPSLVVEPALRSDGTERVCDTVLELAGGGAPRRLAALARPPTLADRLDLPGRNDDPRIEVCTRARDR